jgi:hypothetical protein
MQKVIQDLKDPRYFQILFLGSFLSYGLLFLGWKVDYLQYVAVISTSVVTQIAFSLWKGKPLHSIKSALITSLGLSMLLKAASPWYFALAGFIAIASKFLFVYKGKHLFNPANIGIVACLLLTDKVWVSPGQWGSDMVLVFFMGMAGITVLLRIGRIETSLAFLGALFLFQYLRVVAYQGWDFPVLMHKFSSGTLLLFAFFMITDPMTIPNQRRARIPWAILVAVIAFVLSSKYFVYTAAIWALFAVTPVTVLIDHFFKAKKFEWLPLPGFKTSAIQKANTSI